MKKIYLLKMYIEWNDERIPKKLFKSKAKVILAYKNKKKAIESLVDMYEKAKTLKCDLYKKHYYIEEMKLL